MKAFATTAVLMACAVCSSAYAQAVNEEEALMWAFGNEDFISIATGQWQPIAQAPAVASVITAEDIKRIGATDLDQVLETVPGLHVSVAPRGYLPLYTLRGIYSENNPQVLFLINDIPITNQYVGNRGELWGGMPVNNVKRIEIIRGPGSSVYGADAFAGTINILTKTADDVNGMEFGARAGSFKTHEGWMLYGGKRSNFDIAFSLELLKSDGHDGRIEADAQTGLDAVFGTDASLSPGPVNLQRDNIDTRLDVSNEHWQIRLGYQGRRDLSSGAGVAQALDPEATGDSDRYSADITYSNAISESWNFSGQVSYFDISAKPDLVLYPPGAFAGSFPEGMIAQPYVYERHGRLNLSAFYHGIDNHNIRLGLGGAYSDMHKIKELKNYTFAPNGFPLNLGSVVDASNDSNLVFIQPHDRDIHYFFLQDEWSVAPDWTLTGGIRYDHYSDFGDTTNPRLALVWQTRYNLTSKLLYGRAFRAPAFNEFYNINNPVALGNPDLEPEKIDTYEIAFDYQHSDWLNTKLNLFRFRMTDIIRFVPDPLPATTVTAQNKGERHGHGLELEASLRLTTSVNVYGNYAYQNSTEEDTDSDVANAPQHQIYVRGDWNLASEWRASGQVNWVADRERDVTDSRPKIDDYTTVDLTLRYQPMNRPWALALSARNLFDADAREPSPAPGSIPNDLPLAERNVYIEGTYFLGGSSAN